MKTKTLAALGVLLLALAGCAELTARTGLTADQQVCLANEGAAWAAGIPGWADLSFSQRAAAVAAGVDQAVTDCGVQSALYDKAKPIVATAIQAAAGR